MTDSRPTQVGFFGAVRLCVLLLLAPHRFIEAEQRDARNRDSCTGQEQEHGAYLLRRAFIKSVVLVAMSAAVGYGAGMVIGTVRCATVGNIALLQVVGACLLLWGTLFVRGWEIQTYSGVSFTERVNQWLYRFLYCVGTSLIVCSLAWAQC